MERSTPELIFENLFDNPDYTQKVLPHLKPEYFQEPAEQALIGVFIDYVDRYKAVPARQSMYIEIENLDGITLDEVGEMKSLIRESTEKPVETNWIIDTTEKFVKDRALHLAFIKSMQIADDSGKYDSRGEIPELMKDALSISFTTDIGAIYHETTEEQYDFYHSLAEKFPTKITLLDYYMDRGPEKGTLNILMGPSGSGKSMWLCHFAASYIQQGYNVVYLTLEMSEHKIQERIDSNLLDMDIKDIKKMGHDAYHNKIEAIKKKTKGSFVVKQFPTGAANVNHFRHYLGEVANHLGAKPDIVLIDYVNLCASSRVKLSGNINTYSYIKFITEEMRGLAIEFDLPIWTATQTNRGGVGASDLSEADISESYGTVMTVDFLAGLITNDELEERNQQICKILKNRYGELKAFPITISRSKMKLYNIENQDINEVTDQASESEEEQYEDFKF